LKIVQRIEFHAGLWLRWQRKEKTIKISFIKPKELELSIKHLLMGVYQVCSNNIP
jgi:hypothetical protein